MKSSFINVHGLHRKKVIKNQESFTWTLWMDFMTLEDWLKDMVAPKDKLFIFSLKNLIRSDQVMLYLVTWGPFSLSPKNLVSRESMIVVYEYVVKVYYKMQVWNKVLNHNILTFIVENMLLKYWALIFRPA